MVRLEREIREFVKKGGNREEKFGVRLEELEQQCEGSSSGSLMSSCSFFFLLLFKGVLS